MTREERAKIRAEALDWISRLNLIDPGQGVTLPPLAVSPTAILKPFGDREIRAASCSTKSSYRQFVERHSVLGQLTVQRVKLIQAGCE